MRTKFKGILTLLLAFIVQLTFAQEKTVTGTVIDKDGLPIPGVNVIIKNTTTGTQTDFDGNFAIKVSNSDVLVFSYQGMKKVEMSVGSKITMNISMIEDVEALEEVVITTYGNPTSQRKITSSAVQLTNEKIENRPNINVLNSLEGQAAGVNISSFSGQPGSNKIDVIIRGQGTLTASTEPLFVIDGVPLTEAFYRNLNPNDIESVTILKDAAATAIYGNRGANGVIVVETKKGDFDQSLSISYANTYGFTEFIDDDYNLGSALDHLRLQRRGFEEGVGALASSLAVTGEFLNGAITVDPDNLEAYDVNTDWSEEFFRRGVTESHDLSLSFGSKNLRNFSSFGFLDQDGTVPTTDFKRFTIRNNFSGKSNNEKFEFGLNVFAAYSERNQLEQETRGGINANVLQNPLTGYLSSSRFIPTSLYQSGQQLFDDFGNPALNLTPLMLLDLFRPNSQLGEFQETKTIANLNASYKILDNLTFGIQTAVDYSHFRRNFAIGPESYLSIVRASGAGTEFDGIEVLTNVRNFMFNHVNRLTFADSFDKHSVSASLFTEYVKAHRRAGSFQQRGLNPLTWSPGAGTGYIEWNENLPLSYVPQVSASERNAGLFSYFGTVDYDYDGKFGINATVRRDGTYRFVGDNQWGTFWSIGGRYNISEEEFMKNVSFIEELKIRGSYGITGNQNVIARDIDSSISEIFGGSQLVRSLNISETGYNNLPSFAVSSIANEDLRWEETTQWNVGVDFGLFQNKFTGTIDYYNRLTDQLYQALPISGANSVYTINSNEGAIRNTGIEFQGRYNVFRKGDFKLSLSANFAYNKDSFDDLGRADDDGDGQFRSGDNFVRNLDGELFEHFRVPYLGVNPANGNLLFLDINGNVTENPTDQDRRSTGKSLLPTYQGGFGFDVEYKGFYVNTSFQFVEDFWRIDVNYSNLMDPRNGVNFPLSNDLLNAWTPNNRQTDIPALAANNIDAAVDLSDRFLRDSSFLRLRNITFGYNFSDEFLENTPIQSLSLRIVGENLLTFSKWKGLDPARFRGDSLGDFPVPRILTFGVNVNF